MISNAENVNEVFPGLRKAAIAIVTLGDDVAADVFRFLTEDEVQLVGREVSKLNKVTPEQAENTLQEFHEMSMAQDYLMSGGIEYAKRVMNSAFGPDRARLIIDRVVRSLGEEIPTFDTLQKADPLQVAKFIEAESPQTIALVLSHLNSSSAAGMLLALQPDVRADVAMRMASLDQISPEIVSRIAGILDQKLSSLGQFSRESYGGIPAVAEMFNRLESNAGQELLGQIEDTDSEMGEAIRNLMFVFEDLLLIDSIGMREILSRVDKKTLTIALKGTSDGLREHFFGNMSERGADMLQEDMEALETEGVISLKGAVGEQYVV